MFKLAIKDLRLFFNDKRASLLTFALPIALITLFAFAFGAAGKTKGAAKKYDLPVCDLDSTKASKDAITKIDSLKTIHVVRVQFKPAQEAVKKGKEDCVLIFHRGFSDSLHAGNPLPIELQYDAAQEMQVGLLEQSLFQILAMLPYTADSGNIMKETMNKQFDKMLGKSDDKLKSKVHTQFDTLYSTLNKGIKLNTDTSTNSTSGGFSMGSDIKMTKLVEEKTENSLALIHAVAGTAIMMLLFSVAGMGASLLDEKQEGTLKKLLISPMHPNSILFGKMISSNIISITQLSIMFLYARLVFGLGIRNHLPSLALMIIVTAYACSSFGVFLASFAKSRQQVQGLSTIIVLVMSCIGGSMVPLFLMPAFMQKMAVFSVNYWGIQGFYDIYWRLLPITDTTFLSRVLVLLLIGTVLNLAALRMFRKNILAIA